MTKKSEKITDDILRDLDAVLEARTAQDMMLRRKYMPPVLYVVDELLFTIKKDAVKEQLGPEGWKRFLEQNKKLYRWLLSAKDKENNPSVVACIKSLIEESE